MRVDVCQIPLHVAFLTGAMVITTGSGYETGLAYAIIGYTAARTAWLACYKGAPKPLDASNLLSVLYGTCLYTLCAPCLHAPYASLLAPRGAQSRCPPAQARRCSPCSPVCSSRLLPPSQGRRELSATRTERGKIRCSKTGPRNGEMRMRVARARRTHVDVTREALWPGHFLGTAPVSFAVHRT